MSNNGLNVLKNIPTDYQSRMADIQSVGYNNKLLQEAKSDNDFKEYLRLSLVIANEYAHKEKNNGGHKKEFQKEFDRLIKVVDYYDEQLLIIESKYRKFVNEVKSGIQPTISLEPKKECIKRLEKEIYAIIDDKNTTVPETDDELLNDIEIYYIEEPPNLEDFPNVDEFEWMEIESNYYDRLEVVINKLKERILKLSLDADKEKNIQSLKSPMFSDIKYNTYKNLKLVCAELIDFYKHHKELYQKQADIKESFKIVEEKQDYNSEQQEFLSKINKIDNFLNSIDYCFIEEPPDIDNLPSIEERLEVVEKYNERLEITINKLKKLLLKISHSDEKTIQKLNGPEYSKISYDVYLKLTKYLNDFIVLCNDKKKELQQEIEIIGQKRIEDNDEKAKLESEVIEKKSIENDLEQEIVAENDDKVERVKLTEVSDEYGYKAYTHTEETKEKIRKALKAFHADRTNPRWIAWHESILAYHRKKRQEKSDKEIYYSRFCNICGEMFVTTDKSRICCYGHKGSCQRKYNFKTKKTKIKVASKKVMSESYKLRMIKAVIAMFESDLEYKELLFENRIQFVNIFESKVKIARKEGVIPLRFGISKKSIEKYFGKEENFVNEIKRYISYQIAS